MKLSASMINGAEKSSYTVMPLIDPNAYGTKQPEAQHK